MLLPGNRAALLMSTIIYERIWNFKQKYHGDGQILSIMVYFSNKLDPH